MSRINVNKTLVRYYSDGSFFTDQPTLRSFPNNAIISSLKSFCEAFYAKRFILTIDLYNNKNSPLKNLIPI